MQFSDLPPEVIHEILVACVRARQLHRALRLRHVSRAWDAAVVGAVFASGVLDADWCIFIEWPRYLAYRVTGSAARRKGWPRSLFVLRRVAERLVTRRNDGAGGSDDLSDDAVADCIGELCATMQVGCAFRMPPDFEPLDHDDDSRRVEDEPIGEDDDQLLQALLSVAAARNDVAFVKDLLQRIHDRPWLVYADYRGGDDDHKPLFRQPLEEAAFAGHDEVVHILLDFKASTSDPLAVRKAKAIVFDEACRGGKLSTLDIVFESMRAGYAAWEEALVGTMEEVTDVDMFKRLYSYTEEFIDAEKSEDEGSKDHILCNLLCQAAGKGAIPLMEHLMELGATPENPAWSRESDVEDPLEGAVIGGHTEAVIYLLEKGFCPGDFPKVPVDDCLVAAVRWKSLHMVESILSHLNRESPDFGRRLESSLEMAVERENERILSMLLTFGSTAVTNKVIRRLKYKAEDLGLESMADFLRGYLPADDDSALSSPTSSTWSESSGSDNDLSGSE